ncbi:MAG: bifunctional UDP-N-acetylglucosamine diphosphorylase/glucosamine-1-phosphate N-acetyltransferase GlmU [Alphaproteobacteria bacterium]
MYCENTAVVILAAGKGTRMRSARSKVLHKIGQHPLLGHVLSTAAALNPEKIIVVVGPDMPAVAAVAAPHPVVVQHMQRGTADAVKPAREALADFAEGTVFILYGDTPFIRKETLLSMLKERAAGSDIVVLGFRPDDPAEYGRLILGQGQLLERIVEFREADDTEKAVGLCNSGVLAVDAARLFPLIDQVRDNNEKGEFYLTDIVALARRENATCTVVEAEADELQGINSRSDLAVAEGYWQQLRRAEAMENGVTLLDPATVYFSYDTVLEADVTIGPNVVFGPGVTVGRDSEIKAFSHLEGATVGEGVTVGPFARLRPGAVLENGAFVGNFVEVKNAVMGTGAKASHLSYIGDTDVGENANIGAGTITCNYDGFFKYRTTIGKGAFIGSNSALVSPVNIGDGAIIAAGSVITDDVSSSALALGRGKQAEKPGWALAFRTEQQEKKDRLKHGKD